MVIMVLALLGVQAYCDLALPQYTSDMIDVGIQNHGFKYAVPEVMTESEMPYSTLFMTDEEKDGWNSLFHLDGDKYVRNDMTEERLDEESERYLVPIILTYQTGNTSEAQFRQTISQAMMADPAAVPEGFDINSLTLEQIEQFMHTELSTYEAEDENGVVTTYIDMRPIMAGMLMTGQMNAEQLTVIREQMENTLETIGSSTMKSMGISYAVASCRDAGADIDKIQTDYMWSQGLKMLIMSVFMLAASVAAGYLAARTGAGVGRDLREKVFRRVMSYSTAEMEKFSTASLITRSTNDVQQIQFVTAIMLRMLMYAPIIGIGGIIKVAATKSNMGWIIFAAVGIILVMVAVLMVVAMPKFKAMQKLVDNLNLVSREILTGLPVIRAFGREEVEEQRFDKANSDLMKNQLFTNRVMVFMMPGMSMIMYGISLTIVWVAAHRIDAGTLQVGTMTAFITYSMQIVMSFLMLTMMSIMLPRAGVAADRINEVLTTDPTVLEPENAESIESAKGVVRFESVDFRYPGAEEDALSGIDFTAEPGKTTAIIGSTGCGKSTLINLIPRFFDVTGGKITIDGKDIRSMKKKELRGLIGLVPQKGILFSGTIASNLRFGARDASDEKLRQAAETAQAMEFIQSDVSGFDRLIAQGGTNVSGGQKQRLAIARAIIRDPKIYIFDDSFSALDMKTDAALRKALEQYVKDATVLIVAQRISTIMNADQIIVLDEGRIVGKGTHRELLKNCDTYLQIASSQLSEEEIKNSMGGEE